MLQDEAAEEREVEMDRQMHSIQEMHMRLVQEQQYCEKPIVLLLQPT